MKKVMLGILATLAIIGTAHAEEDFRFSRQYALDQLLRQGYDVAYEDMGEMFKHSIFILANADVCDAIGAELWDDSRQSCLLQVKDDGMIGSFYSENPNALYE